MKISDALNMYRQYFTKCEFTDNIFKMLRIRVESRRLSGSESQIDGPATAKHRRPLLSSRSRGTVNRPTYSYDEISGAQFTRVVPE